MARYQHSETKERVKTTWAVRTYDVWGNARDGFDVNDSYSQGEVEIVCRVHLYNIGTPQEFKSATPSDKQIREVFGIGRTRIDTDGDDLTIYVNRHRDGYPIGELYCTSHESLSPIREKQ
jgi:hypothetical protein